MKRWALVVCSLVVGLAFSAPGFAGDEGKLNVYKATVSGEQLAQLSRSGFDLLEGTRQVAGGTEVNLVLTPRERARLAARGIKTTLARDKQGRTIQQRAALQAANGFTVWRSFDEPGGLRDEMYALAMKNSGFLKLVVLGRTHQGREIIALKLTQGAKGVKDGSRPAALYLSTQHAREWISTEVNRRFLLWLLERRKAEDPEIVDLLKTRELWFVLVANPDGYEYTHDVERLWRKNLRDNNGDGQITNGDGVDPNRNYPSHWNFDNEGSSSQFSSETYRGPSEGSEPETKAIMGLAGRVPFKFVVNWHSVGSWILYAPGWQMGTVAADDPIYLALAGTDASPAIPGFDPGPSADELYVTNGETTDWFASQGGLGFTPELSDANSGGGFVFPDDPVLVQQEADNARPFALDVAKSAADPANPASHLGNVTEPFYLELTSLDPEASLADKRDFRFSLSYGDPQEVRVLAKRSLGDVSVKYQVNGGPVQTAPTTEWAGGQRYGQEGSVYYHVMRGFVTGTSPGDSVNVWFEGGGASSESFTYQAVNESANDVLVMAAEDYSGASGGYPAGPRPFLLSYYADALAANGIGFDVYDVDGRGRTAPDALGVLSHYGAVIWYTGNDIVTREPGWGPGNVSRLANDEILEVRAFVNEGGGLLYTGNAAGQQATQALGNQRFDAFENKRCSDPAISPRCLPFGGSGDGTNDFLQYWLGSYILNPNAGFNPDTGNLYDVLGVDTPLEPLTFGFNGADSAANQDRSSSFITTSGILGPDYPQFDSWPSAKYDRPGGPFSPHTGTKYMYSQIGDIAYKRLTREIAVPAGGATLSFWTSYDTEIHWDHLFVEARTAGGTDWTTLPDANGHTSQDTGDSCPAGWRDLHPHLDHYQTLNADGTCSPTGTSGGAWNAASGNSGGWQQWQVDLSAWEGQTVEVSIGYANDWAVQGLGVFLDDTVVSTGEGTTSFEDDGDPMDGWTVTGPPAGSGPNPNNFVLTDASGFPEAAVVATDDTLYMGFGFEGITGSATRAAVMGRAMSYLLR